MSRNPQFLTLYPKLTAKRLGKHSLDSEWNNAWDNIFTYSIAQILSFCFLLVYFNQMEFL